MKRHHHRFPLTFTALLALPAVACGGGDTGIGPPSPGSFGQAGVEPECGAFHQACLSRGLDSPLAVGSQLGLGVNFELAGTSGPPTDLASSDADVLTIDDGVATITGPGLAVILIKGPDQRVVDFIHVFSVEPDELRVIRYNDDGLPIGGVRSDGTILDGDEILVAVESFTGSQPLLGLFDTQWTVEITDDPTGSGEPIVSVVDDVVFGLFRIVARRPGSVRLTGSALNTEKIINLEVLP